jgi:aldose 1-epimerase
MKIFTPSFSGIAIGLLFFCSSCNDNPNTTDNQKTTDSMEVKTKSGIKQDKYGMLDGQEITQFTLANAAGMTVKIINYGGTVTNIIVPDKSGNGGDVVLGFDSLSGYTQKENPYFGCLVGRYGNRIANGKFTLDGKKYKLSTNDHGHTLHGGIVGFNRKVWAAQALPGDSSIKLSYTSTDGEEGFPGTLKTEVIYTLTADNALKIEYQATTDKATPVNLTNHSYFNLSAGKDSTVLAHKVLLNADKYTAVDKTLIPTGALPPVKGTPMDFTVPVAIGTDIQKVEGGYDHNWILSKKEKGIPELAATVLDPESGRYMEVSTTEPGIQFYTGNFLDGSLTGKNGLKYVKHGALCLEAQHFPDFKARRFLSSDYHLQILGQIIKRIS